MVQMLMSNPVFGLTAVSRRLGPALLAIICGLAPAILGAQPNEDDTGEVAAFVGGITGIGSHPSYGGSVGEYISRHALILFEGSYTPLGHDTIQPWPAKSSVERSHLTDFNFSVHVPIIVRKRWSPYGIAGVSLLWNALRQGSAGPNGVAVTRHFDQFNAAFETGGGLRYYIAENWGIRPELTVVVNKQTYTRLSMGIFYVVPSNWP